MRTSSFLNLLVIGDGVGDVDERDFDEAKDLGVRTTTKHAISYALRERSSKATLVALYTNDAV